MSPLWRSRHPDIWLTDPIQIINYNFVLWLYLYIFILLHSLGGWTNVLITGPAWLSIIFNQLLLIHPRTPNMFPLVLLTVLELLLCRALPLSTEPHSRCQATFPRGILYARAELNRCGACYASYVDIYLLDIRIYACLYPIPSRIINTLKNSSYEEP